VNTDTVSLLTRRGNIEMVMPRRYVLQYFLCTDLRSTSFHIGLPLNSRWWSNGNRETPYTFMIDSRWWTNGIRDTTYIHVRQKWHTHTMLKHFLSYQDWKHRDGDAPKVCAAILPLHNSSFHIISTILRSTSFPNGLPLNSRWWTNGNRETIHTR